MEGWVDLGDWLGVGNNGPGKNGPYRDGLRARMQTVSHPNTDQWPGSERLEIRRPNHYGEMEYH